MIFLFYKKKAQLLYVVARKSTIHYKEDYITNTILIYNAYTNNKFTLLEIFASPPHSEQLQKNIMVLPLFMNTYVLAALIQLLSFYMFLW